MSWYKLELLPATDKVNKCKIKSIAKCFPDLGIFLKEYVTEFILDCSHYILKCQFSLTWYKSLEKRKVLGPGNGSSMDIAVCFGWQASWFHRDHVQMSRKLENSEILKIVM